MFRTTDIVLIGVMVAGAAFTYQVKRSSELELEHINKLQTQIQLEEDTMDVLKADWSLLVQPARLQRLEQAHQAELQLQPVAAQQVVTFADLPPKPAAAPPGGQADEREASAKAGKDKIVTGAVNKTTGAARKKSGTVKKATGAGKKP